MEKIKLEKSRIKNTTRNILFAMSAYLLQTVLSFIVRRYFIFYFSEEYLGLNSLFANVISLLSFVELGFGTAIVFQMYKPMADNDEEKVRQLLQYYKKCYSIIGTIVLCAGLCVLPFIGYFKAKAPNVNVSLTLIYLIYLMNTVVSYFLSYRRSLLYTSQRNDIESKINIICNFTLIVGQLIVILTLQNYYLYIILIGLVNLLNNLLVYILTQKKYAIFVKKPNSKLSPDTIKTIRKDIFALFFHKIGGTVVYSTDSLIIFIMLGAATLGIYSNYLMITAAVTTLIGLFLNAVRSSVGNSIAKESVEYNQQVFKKLNFLYMWLVGFCSIAIFVLSDSFIKIILTKNTEQNLLFSKEVVFLIALSFYCLQARYMVCVFKESAGLFYEDRIKPLVEAMVNLIVSIFLANFIGIAGVIIGTIASDVCVCMWIEPKVLNKFYLKTSNKKYFFTLFVRTLITLLIGGLTYFLCNLVPNENLFNLAVRFFICAVVPNLLFALCYFWTPEFKYYVDLFISLVRKHNCKDANKECKSEK